MAQSDLRKFRTSVAILKKQGLISDTLANGRKLDARSAYPSWKVKGKRLDTLIRKYDDVVSGKATAVKVSPAKAKAYAKTAGYERTGERVLVPHSRDESARANRMGEIVIRNKNGLERVQLPVEYHNLAQYLQGIKTDSKRIDRMKGRNEYWGFRFFGNNSSEIFRNIDMLVDFVSRYNDVLAAKGRKKQQEVYRNLEIIKISDFNKWTFPSERKKESSKAYNRKQAKKWRESLKSKPLKVQKAAREANAQKQRDYRARLKNNPKQAKAYKTAAKKRAAKSRKKASKKK